MTVQRLMEQLSKYPRDREVVLIGANEEVTYDISHLETRKDWDETVVVILPDVQ